MKANHTLKGSSQTGYPTKRIEFEIQYCDDQHLQSIGSSKKCAPREEVWKWVEKLDLNAHFERHHVDLNNIRQVSNIFDTKRNLIKG